MSQALEVGRQAWWLDDLELAERGYQRCEHCGALFPACVSRHRSRRCPGYSETWSRDAMRKIRVNLQGYGGLTCAIAVTAPGEEVGLIWDRELCRHRAGERCSGPKGCVVVADAAAAWNDGSRRWWRELNRVCKQRADRKISQLGAKTRGGLLMYEWELQKRGVWHLHVVLGMETAVERVWAIEYVAALCEVGPSKGSGFIDRKPLRSPRPAEKAAWYLSKYLAKWLPDGRLEISETVKSAGRTLLNYTSRNLTRKTGCTMRALRNVRVVWAWREGFIPDHGLNWVEFLSALCLLEQALPARAP
jgi:hypothetical protein